ncbi:MAG: lamin tail domain-containing protein [Alphaproteobacteria bacterium]|nr:lamin tail domain-containing protein [Alphaproteobacteria bacterium]
MTFLLPAALLLACGSDTKLGRIPSPPTARISSPTADDPWRQGSGLITLTGVVSDEQDDADTLTAWWELGELRIDSRPDADGAVAAGIDPSDLAPGPQLVRLAVTDSDDDYGDHTLEYLVMGPLGAPTVTITAPEMDSTWAPGQQVSFQGEATDDTTPAEDLVFAWSSDLDGALPGELSSEGRSILLTESLSEGVHQVTLSVTDTDGETGTDTVRVFIEEGGGDSGAIDEDDAEPGDLVLSELMVNPEVVYDTAGEWFELYNTSGRTIDIHGYTLRDDDYDTWVISESMRIPPGEYFLVCAEMNPITNGGVEGCDAWFLRPDLPPPGMAFGNNGDEVILERPDGVEIDRLVYDDSWVRTAQAVGVDPRELTAEGNDDMAHWCGQTTVMTSGGEPGTPGVENDRCW